MISDLVGVDQGTIFLHKPISYQLQKDTEETTIVQWLSSDSMRDCCSSKTKKHGMPSTLSEKERSEIEDCMRVFEQLPVYNQFETIKQEKECEMPNFNLGFDFLSEHV